MHFICMSKFGIIQVSRELFMQTPDNCMPDIVARVVCIPDEVLSALQINILKSKLLDGYLPYTCLETMFRLSDILPERELTDQDIVELSDSKTVKIVEITCLKVIRDEDAPKYAYTRIPLYLFNVKFKVNDQKEKRKNSIENQLRILNIIR